MTTSQAPTAARIIVERGLHTKIGTAIVLGTGLGALADAVENALVIPFADLPGFPHGNVSGHAGRLVIGKLEGADVALLQGRAHYYEHGDPRVMATALETLQLLGVETLLLTNSAGSLQPDWPPGSLALIADHINYSGLNPLIGVASDKRFVPMNDAYAPDLRDKLRSAALREHIALPEGVYMWFAGPSFETPAEVRMAKLLGADLVGMSTVPETILARFLGLRVAAVSMVTNFAAGFAGGNPSHHETKDVALQGAAALQKLVRAFLRQ
ncbi:purine-nucleoside phosphorylase [Methylovirgula sp. 4M-Z18]|uniref:purine-nucleoside phosphorylase n=1 Tax=Methylovirgula sp. 4M-Z18 TaxID=2293567 RepID=UPI000E2EDC4A|nr:purine-nucleoside phosphorylase [Methylovirgula sp. 4M-Z18]RFB81350.1 purine-nucleoside phosphorylase [Methylovirgula sp. 4M-Z18]